MGGELTGSAMGLKALTCSCQRLWMLAEEALFFFKKKRNVYYTGAVTESQKNFR